MHCNAHMTHPSHHARSSPDHLAIVMAGSGETVTYRDVEARSNQGAHLFRHLGMQRGDRIAIMMDNCADYLIVCFAAQRSGLVFTAMSTRLSVSEAAYIVADCGAKVILISASLGTIASAMFEHTNSDLGRFSIGGSIPRHESWDAVIATMPTTPIPDQSAGRDMLYSSGTTGRPKGVKVDLLDEAFDAPTRHFATTAQLYGFGPTMRYLSPAPLYHAAPLRFCMTALRHGGTVVVMERFDATAALAAIERHQITHAQWVPSMFVRILKLPDALRERTDVSSLRCAIHAAAPCPVPVKRAMLAWWGPIIHEYYAGTEGNGFVACTSAEWAAHPGTVGRAVTGEIRIVADDGCVMGPGADNIGTIYFAGGTSFEYHNDPDKTAQSRNKEGWSTLGDVGYVDADGFLFLTDRKAHMIISGGVNIYPQEVEDLLVTHPRIADAAVVGVPSEEFGEEVKAVVQPIDWADATPAFAEALIAYCRTHMSHVKCPRSIDFDRELPRHPTGKLYKRLIRDRYWQGRTNKLV